jgi:integrase
MVNVFRPIVKGKKTKRYYGKIRDPKTKKWIKVSLGVTDKQVAKKELEKRQARLERRSFGLVDDTGEASVADCLADFVRHLQHQNRGAGYQVQTECEIIKVALFCAGRPLPDRIDRKAMASYREMIRPVRLEEITPDRVDDFLASLPDRVAARTRNGYRTSVINLFNFLVQKRRLPYNPLLSVTRHRGEKKHQRRALPTPQLQRLFDAARVRPLAQAQKIGRGARKGQLEAKLTPETRAKLEWHGRQRALIYLTAFYTGFRRGELRAMRVKHLFLSGDHPHIALPGALTKNGQDAAIPLPPVLVEQLRDWTQGMDPADAVFRVPKYDELLKCLKKDLAFAGIPYRDDRGRVFDFHSLRKSLGTALRLAKVDPAVSQKYMRHGDIRLTLETYNDDQLHDLQAEVTAKLPVFTI